MKELSTTSFGEDRGGTTGANFTFLLSPPASYKPTDNQTDTEYNVKNTHLTAGYHTLWTLRKTGLFNCDSKS